MTEMGLSSLPVSAASLLTAGESLESLDVVLALGDGVGLLVVLVALLHAFQHLGALGVRHVEGAAGEVGSKEITERWHGSSGNTGSEILSPCVWSWWCEESGVVELESLHIRM